MFGGDGEQVLTISARTGIPVSSVVTGRGMRTSVETFRISRVTHLADDLVQATLVKFYHTPDQPPHVGTIRSPSPAQPDHPGTRP